MVTYFHLRVLSGHIELHLFSQMEKSVIWDNSFFLYIVHYYLREVEIFEGLSQLVEVQMCQLIVEQ